jgi:hypothetical protein
MTTMGAVAMMVMIMTDVQDLWEKHYVISSLETKWHYG